MAFANGVRFIWLDKHIGTDEHCKDLKTDFREALAPTAAMPPDSINALIFTLEMNAAPFEFVDTPEQAVTLIEGYWDKQIVFISSGSMGKDIIPMIVKNYPYVYSFYIFCLNMQHCVDWAMEFRHCLQMFTFELDLLVRLARDISKDIIKQGEIHMNVDDPENALKCFEHSLTLETEANNRDKLNQTFFDHIKLLNGYGDNVGLIQNARDKIQEKRKLSHQKQ